MSTESDLLLSTLCLAPHPSLLHFLGTEVSKRERVPLLLLPSLLLDHILLYSLLSRLIPHPFLPSQSDFPWLLFSLWTIDLTMILD